MAQTIKTINQLAKVLEDKIKATLKLVAADVKKEVDKYLQEYYDEYDPNEYFRTEQLLNCCKIRSVKSDGRMVGIEVYLDINSLRYNTKDADAFKTVVAANSGLHGGWDISILQNGQVPWSVISDNDGISYGNGTQIWEEPIRELIDKGRIIAIFKKCAKTRGLDIK